MKELEYWLTAEIDSNSEEIKKIIMRHLKSAQEEMDAKKLQCKIRFGSVSR